MRIVAICPRCQSRYQVEPNLRGQFMRCPNSMCRAVFEVKDPEAPAPPPVRGPERAPTQGTPSRQVSGSVGEIVPILTAEATVAEPPVQRPIGIDEEKSSAHIQEIVPLLPAEVIESQQPGPPRQDAEEEHGPAPWDSLDPTRSPAQRVETPQGTHELPPGAWDAPPVRLPGATAIAQKPIVLDVRSPTEPVRERRARRRSRRLILLVFFLVTGGLAAGFYLVRGRQAENEAQRFERAEKLYQDHQFADAVLRLQNLVRAFPESKDRRRYLFLAELGDVRDPVYHPQGDAGEAARTHDRLLQFLEVYKGDPLLTEYQQDIHHTFLRLAKELSAGAGQTLDRAVLVRARRALEQAGQFEAGPSHNSSQVRDLQASLSQAETAIAAREKRLVLHNTIRDMAGKPSAAAVQGARSLVRQAGLVGDSEFTLLLNQLVHAHAASVTYTKAFEASRTEPMDDEKVPSLLVAPEAARQAGLSARNGDRSPASSAPVLALARGVLYSLDPHNGRVIWARRVGADSAQLPLRLPATPISPECLLVLSSDHKTLTCVTAEAGKAIWQQQLTDPCLGQPVLLGKHIFVPTQSGRVDEIEIIEGRLLGYYHLGQPLSTGGVQQPETSLVYFPADEFTIYILDVARRACAGVLYAGHPRGALRSPPLILQDPDAPRHDAGATVGTSGWLLLSQVDGDAVKLRLFALPIRDPDQSPLPLDAHVRGNSNFPPWTDGERLAMASDAGFFSLWGVKQKGTREPPLFPLLKDDVVLGKAGPGEVGGGLIAHADAENFWVLAHGRLHRVQSILHRESGPGHVQQPWSEPPFLGAPLHASQVPARGAGHVFLATQLPGATCLASAVDPQHGTLSWQRQLGLVCRGQPLAFANRVFVRDSSGLFLFDPAELPAESGQPWPVAGERFFPFTREESGHLLMNAAGTRACALLHSAAKAGTKVQVVELGTGQRGQPNGTVLPSSLAGTPALGDDAIIMPLRDGILARLGVDGSVVQGLHWRAPGVDDREQGHVTAVNADHYLVTDGSRGLSLLHWPAAKVSESKVTVQLPRRIAAPPTVLRGPEVRVAVADTADTVTLHQGERLRIIRRWSLGGKITAGPFARGTHLGCVVGKQRLVWLDPERDQPLWEYSFVAPIVGQPELVAGQLVVADLAGRFIALDPENGRPLGPGYTLRANVTPAAAPVAFGPNRLFAPLTDGTVLVLRPEDLRHPLQAFPLLPSN
jgi:outer membrane protein assembly factor BamB